MLISPRLLRLLLWDFPTSNLLLLVGSTGNEADWLEALHEGGLVQLVCCLLVQGGGESTWSDFLSTEKYGTEFVDQWRY